MPIVSVTGRKGGVGKTTTVVSLAVELHARGWRVLIVDADSEDHNGSAMWWAELAAERGADSPPVVSMGDNLRADLPSLARGYDVVIVDTPGAAERRTVYALALSQLALMPCGTSGIEIAKMGKTIEQTREVQRTFRKLKAAILVTRVDRSTVEGRQAAAILKETDVDVLETELGASVVYRYAITAGQGPTTYDPASDAAREVRALASELGKYGIGGYRYARR